MKTIHLFFIWIQLFSIEQILLFIFFIFLLTEWIIGKLKKRKIHDFKDSFRNTAIGLISFFVDSLFTILTLPLWLYMFGNLKLFEFEQDSLYIIVILFVLIDFSEYWFHRLSHEVNLLWSAHVVHHQSNFFNLTVGLRTSFFVPFFNIFFYSVFPVLGFSPENVLLIILVQGIYQLLIHTKLIGKLGFLENLIVTPSAHRVHHGKNEIYVDKNYGKFLIVWDRVFGTYERETEKVEFGITKPMEKENVSYSIFGPFKKLLKAMLYTKNLRAWRVLLFKSPNTAGKLQESILQKAQLRDT